ncbi:MAG: hypothetical protein VR68_16640 [Peptococcaceae bacterium BRH_c4a]|nr:MAG: hypothetical protein VR68_16640 [Peptococcaceae bacterium BRH_c4a]
MSFYSLFLKENFLIKSNLFKTEFITEEQNPWSFFMELSRYYFCLKDVGGVIGRLRRSVSFGLYE